VENLGGGTRFVAAVNNITAGGGGDAPGSQLVSVFQSVTGDGQVIDGTFGTFTIPPKRHFRFRQGAARLIVLWTDAPFHTPNNTLGYPGPTMAQVIGALVNYGPLGWIENCPDRRRSLRGHDDTIAADTKRNLASRSLQANLGPDAIRVLGMVRFTFSSFPALANDLARQAQLERPCCREPHIAPYRRLTFAFPSVLREHIRSLESRRRRYLSWQSW
jgi:hypothetical protein